MNQFIGRLYYFAFVAELKYFLGVKQATWYRIVVVALLAVTLYVDVRLLIPAVIFTAILLYGLFWQAKRAGYIVFVAEAKRSASLSVTQLAAEERVSVQATGLFSVNDREQSLVQKPAELWHTTVGEYVLMVTYGNGYLYQFVKPAAIIKMTQGELFFGAKAQSAIQLNFQTDWAPSLNTADQAYYVGSQHSSQPRPERTIYLTFHTDEAFGRVWQSISAATE